MSFFAYDTPEVEEAVVAAFEEKYPDIDVDFESVAFSDIFLKYKTLIAGNTPPDVMTMNFDQAYSFASLGALEPLDEWIKSTNLDTSIYFQATLDMFKVDGVQYSMPATYSDVVLFYNKDLFDAAGLEYPQEDWTVDDVKAAALALTKDTDGDGQLDQFGYEYPWYPIVLEMYNAKIWDPATNKCVLNSEEGIKAIQTIVDSRYGDQYAPNPDQLAQQGDWDMFMAGKLAMMPTGPWAVGTFNEKITTFTYDIAHMPAGDKQATHVYANSYAMAAGSQNKEAAWKFIEFATGPEGTQIRQDGKYEISPVQSVAAGYVDGLAGGNPEHANIFMEVMSYAVAQPVHAHWTEISDAIQPELDLAMSNQKDIKEALDAACAAVDPILAQP
jgi:multiple sugar transport system substrate-binding protein